MKISQEKFNQLSQLDRIEYRQKRDRIDEIFNGSLMVTFIYLFMFLLGFIFLAYIGLLNISAETAKNFMIALYPLVKTIKIVFIVAVVFDIAVIILKTKRRNELTKEFFDCKTIIKPKSKK